MKSSSDLARALRLALPAALACAACGTVAVRVPVMKPAEVNMAGYDTVAVGSMTGNYDRPISGALEEALIGSNRFQVVDRQHMDKVMRELQLSASDLTDGKSAAKLGKVVTAGALIFGDTQLSYREHPTEDHTKDKEGKTHTLYTIKGECLVRATFKVVDVATGRLLVAKTYEEKRDDTNHGFDRRADPIDRDALENAARQAVVERFLKAIVPHQEFQNANFVKDGDLPQLEGGIGWAERGDWKKAQDTFNDAVQAAEKNAKIDSKKLSKAYWDLALSYEYAGDYDKATTLVNKAYALSNDKEMLNELDSIQRLQRDAKKLGEQAGGGAGAQR